jgi:hypothetical protein
MAVTASQVALEVKGVNQTGKVFAEIGSSAGAVVKKIAGIGAAVLGGKAIIDTINSLGHLSDIAQKAGVASSEMTQLSTAMNVLGIQQMQPEMMAVAFSKMNKELGLVGKEGFLTTIEAMSKLETEQQRATAAMRVFGDAGLSMMPLINAAAEKGVESLQAVIDAMPGVSDAAANAGDAVADAMTICTDGLKAMWSGAIGKICEWFDGAFVGGIRGAALQAMAYLKYAGEVAWEAMKVSFSNIVLAYRAMSDDWGKTFSKLWEGICAGFKAVVEFIWEQVKNVGAVMRDFFKELWNGIKGNGFEWGNVVANANFGEVTDKFVSDLSTAVEKGNIFEGVNWESMQTDGFKAVLDEELKNAAAFGEAYSSAAITAVAKEGGKQLNSIQKASRADVIRGESYKAATMTMRADYGGDKTVKAVDALKAVNEKIRKACETTADVMGSLQAV